MLVPKQDLNLILTVTKYLVLFGVVAKEITLITGKLTTRMFKHLQYTDRAVVASPCTNNTVYIQ
jgi:hypothetical protein